MVGARWKALPDDDRKYYQDLAKEDSIRQKEAMKEYYRMEQRQQDDPTGSAMKEMDVEKELQPPSIIGKLGSEAVGESKKSDESAGAQDKKESVDSDMDTEDKEDNTDADIHDEDPKKEGTDADMDKAGESGSQKEPKSNDNDDGSSEKEESDSAEL
eukprot:jgi/Psemu1/309002/fgenesh1_kg.465_\